MGDVQVEDVTISAGVIQQDKVDCDMTVVGLEVIKRYTNIISILIQYYTGPRGIEVVYHSGVVRIVNGKTTCTSRQQGMNGLRGNGGLAVYNLLPLCLLLFTGSIIGSKILLLDELMCSVVGRQHVVGVGEGTDIGSSGAWL